MKNEFVTYEQALSLKELGFDEPCFGYYNYNGTHFFDYKPKTDDKNLTKAPLYQQAFRWFREKYDLCGEVYTVNMGAIDYTFQIRDLYSEDVKHNNFEAYTGGYIGTFLTYEEAEQACLDKLIEICKNK
jgi:hypothetical protein